MKKAVIFVCAVSMILCAAAATGCKPKDVRPTYTAVFYSEEGETLLSLKLKRGDKINAPEVEAKAGYNVVWKSENGYSVEFPLPATDNFVFRLCYERDLSGIECKIEMYFQREDGTYSDVPDETDYFTGITEFDFTFVPSEVEGYVFDADNQNNVLRFADTPGENCVFKVYYARSKKE